MSRLDDSWPIWLRDIDALLPVHPHFVLVGNIRDRYLLPPPHRTADSAAEAILAALTPSGFDDLLVHDVVDGYAVLTDGSEDDGWARVQTVVGRDLRGAKGSDLVTLGEVLRAVTPATRQRLGLVVDQASRLANRATDLSPGELELFRTALRMSQRAEHAEPDGADRDLFNPVMWLVDREHDLPAWFTAGNTGVRTIAVPLPDLGARRTLAERLLPQIADDEARAGAAEKLAKATDGLGAAELFDLTTLFIDHGIDPAEPEDGVRAYRVGVAESPWRLGHVAARMRGGAGLPDAAQALSARVLGQPRAVTKAVDILIRAVTGMSGAHASRSSSRPRGILFFVGPTGTGKTELAKSMTELVFGDVDAYVRFDMSEFAAEHAGDRLIGAPPGYVGFDTGGELTNAVRRRPYSLLLFDEVEKAHPLILDKFLQILEDGRLTDGRGTTVHFSETIIVFTSNIGTYRLTKDGDRVANITPADDYETIEPRVREEVDRYFASTLNRPELRNRIGDNIVVFDFVRPEVGRRIVDLQVANVLAHVRQSAGVAVSLAPEAVEAIRKVATEDLSFGGRGIGNVIESQFVNPLARALFAAGATGGDSYEVTTVGSGPNGPEVQLR